MKEKSIMKWKENKTEGMVLLHPDFACFDSATDTTGFIQSIQYHLNCIFKGKIIVIWLLLKCNSPQWQSCHWLGRGAKAPGCHL